MPHCKRAHPQPLQPKLRNSRIQAAAATIRMEIVFRRHLLLWSQQLFAADTSYSSHCSQCSRCYGFRTCPFTPSALPSRSRAHTSAPLVKAGICEAPGHSSPRNQDRSGLSFQVNPAAGAEGGRSPARKRPLLVAAAGVWKMACKHCLKESNRKEDYISIRYHIAL